MPAQLTAQATPQVMAGQAPGEGGARNGANRLHVRPRSNSAYQVYVSGERPRDGGMLGSFFEGRGGAGSPSQIHQTPTSSLFWSECRCWSILGSGNTLVSPVVV
jgi:hypothetical protein